MTKTDPNAVLAALLDACNSGSKEDFWEALELLDRITTAIGGSLPADPRVPVAEYPVRRFLDLGTDILTQEDKDYLPWQTADFAVYSFPACGIMPRGWFLYAPIERPDGMTDNLWRLCQHARERGCEYILFDADAETHPSVVTNNLTPK